MTHKKPERRGLGRGLSALMADVAPVAAPAPEGTRRRPEFLVPVDQIDPNPDQPRRDFDAAALADLTASIREKGVIQPLIVRINPIKSDRYQIVAGERRWRAAQAAQLHDVPVLVRDFSDAEMLEVAIIENIQRADLNPVEEALGYRQLIDRFGHTQDRLAEALSKSRSYIANLLRLLQLPEEVQGWLREGRLTAGHARALITTDDPVGLARQVMARGLSVRETERLAKSPSPKMGASRLRPREKDSDTRALEQDISAALRMKVAIDHRSDDGGTLVITYKTLDELDQICQILGRGV
jgi:ParB family transcriptional regulator, chromosome partitioning protein